MMEAKIVGEGLATEEGMMGEGLAMEAEMV